MSHDRTQPATPLRNPIATGEYVPDATPDASDTNPSQPVGGRPDGLPDVPGYVVADEIARGGMGRVLAATDLAFGREVAVKVLLPGHVSGEAARRFVRESRITGRLAHPGIPPAYHLGELADGSPFLAMKLVRGRTLAELLKDRPDPAADLPRFVGIFEQVAQAVGFAHSEGVVHRDLKPANVMVGAFGEVQVMDWGLARERGDRDPDRPAGDAAANGDDSLTAAGAVMGTPAYMAPEQARGEDADARADVFALGGVLCEVLTGARPFRGTSGAEVVRKAAAGDVTDAVARLKGCGADKELVDLAIWCLAADAPARPVNGSAVAGLVAAYRAGVEERLQAAERDRAAAEARAAEQRKRRRVQLALAAAVVVLVAGAGGVAVWRVQVAAERRAEVARAADAVGALLDQARAGLEAGDAARASTFLDQAVRRAEGGGADAHADRLAAYPRDLAMLRELDRVNAIRWARTGTQTTDPAAVAARWAAIYSGYGITPGTTPPAEAAARIAASPIRDALVAGLDGWLARDPRPGLVDILVAADPDPFRDPARRHLAARDRAGLVALVGRPEWVDQPSGLIQAYLTALQGKDDAAAGLMARLAARRANDFGLLMHFGIAANRASPDDFDATGPVREPAATDSPRWLQAAVALRPQSATAHTQLGVVLSDNENRAAEAIAHFREALRLDPDEPYARNNLAVALHKTRQTPEALTVLREAVRRDPRDATAYDTLGNILTESGELKEAVVAYWTAIRIEPQARTYSNLAAMFLKGGAMKGAELACREAIRLRPGFVPAHYHLSKALLGMGDHAGAEAAIRTALRLKPADAAAHDELGVVLVARKDAAGAEAAFREAVRLAPTRAMGHYHLGLILAERHEYGAAAAALREAVRLDPRDAYAHANLGEACRRLGQTDEAVRAYRVALAVDPKLSGATVRDALAYCLRVQRGEVPTAPPPRAAGR